MDEAFQRFYRTLDKSKFKYFVKGDECIVYNDDIKLLPLELQTSGRSVRIPNIEGIVREMLTVKGISVEEYADSTLLRSGSPGNFGGFADICLSDSIIPSICGIAECASEDKENKSKQIEFSYLQDGKIMRTRYYDDDLLSRTFSLISTYNCIEALYGDPKLGRVLNNWGISDILSKGSNTPNMIMSHYKATFPVEDFLCEDCCIINIRDYDLVDLGAKTRQGKRLLSQWLRSPLVSIEEIEKRLGFVEYFGSISIDVSGFSDIKRLCAKILSKRILPQEVSKLYTTIQAIGNLKGQFLGAPPNVVATFLEPLEKLEKLFSPLLSDIAEKIDISRGEILPGLTPALAEAERERVSIFRKIEDELTRVRQELPSAKFANKVFKVSRSAYSVKAFEAKNFVVLSVLKSGVTFITREMSELRNKLEIIESKINAENLIILNGLRERLKEFVTSLEIYNYLVALMDIFRALSVKQSMSNYSRPIFSDSEYRVESFFHPILDGCGECVLNSISFGPSSLCVLTGPNMGGKSTLLKALSMVSLYAQIGSYVPAKRAVLPIFDRVFLRIGANDCSSKGLSTFMVEMLDIKRILRTSTTRSLVLIDELGRGTSAVDGLALATAIRDYLLEKQCYTIMATHFSELGACKGVINKRMAIVDGVMTYRLEDGLCDTSFGLHIASKAGFPSEVVESAERYLRSSRKKTGEE